MKTLLIILLIIPEILYSQLKHRTEVLLLMGSRFEITPYAESDSLVNLGIEKSIEEIKRAEQVISEWKEGSEISKINDNAGIQAVQVSEELFGLIKRSKKVSELTEGAFDISWASARGIWKFDGTMTELPRQETLDSITHLINYNNIILNEKEYSVFLKEKGMAIGLGAIGKGYAANRAKMIMLQLGIDNGIVIAGGDLITWGSPGVNKLWPIGIANPENPQNAIAWFEVGPMAVVTSGDYEHYATINNKRYGHIIDPRTCMPVEGIRSVTIICPDAELADALATSVFVLGIDKGLGLINQMKGIECLIIDSQNKFHSSKNLQLNMYQTDQEQNQHTITIGNTTNKKTR